MQDEPIEDPAARLDGAEHAVLHVMLAESLPMIWSERELALVIGNDTETHDAIQGLQAAGLAHRCGVFVFPTRAAIRFAELGILV